MATEKIPRRLAHVCGSTLGQHRLVVHGHNAVRPFWHMDGDHYEDYRAAQDIANAICLYGDRQLKRGQFKPKPVEVYLVKMLDGSYDLAYWKQGAVHHPVSAINFNTHKEARIHIKKKGWRLRRL